jgi:subtilisin family serine protease
MKKRGQVTIFIIIGIIVLFSYSVFLLINTTVQKSDIDNNAKTQAKDTTNLDSEINSYITFVESCLRDITINALESNNKNELSVKHYLNLKGYECFDNSLYPSLTIENEAPFKVEIKKNNNTVTIKVILKTKITKDNSKKIFENFEFSIFLDSIKSSSNSGITIGNENFGFEYFNNTKKDLYVNNQAIISYSHIPDNASELYNYLDSVPVIRRKLIYDDILSSIHMLDEELQDIVYEIIRDEIIEYDESIISFKELQEKLLKYDFVKNVTRNKNSYSEKYMAYKRFREKIIGQDQETQSDTFYRFQWYLDNVGQFAGSNNADIEIEDAWIKSIGSPDTIISIIDEGIFPNSDFSSNILYDKSYNFVDNSYDIFPNSPYEYHGTHVAGLISSKKNNNYGIAGVCPDCKIINMKIFDAYTGADTISLINAVLLSIANGADVISMSLGGTFYSAYEEKVFSKLSDKGIIFVAAAGNDATNEKNYPAAYNGVISVGATDNNDYVSSFSNYGSWVEIYAPGEMILSSCSSQGYCFSSGTSMATPLVSGVIGLMKSINPDLNSKDVLRILKKTAHILPDGKLRLNANSALNSV